MAEEKVIDKLVGWNKEEAIGYCKANMIPCRVVKEDGNAFVVTRDLIPYRLNFTIVEGKVTEITAG